MLEEKLGLPKFHNLQPSLFSLPGRMLHRPGAFIFGGKAQKKRTDRIGSLLYGPAYLSSLQVSFMATEQAMSPRTLQQVAPMSHRVLTEI